MQFTIQDTLFSGSKVLEKANEMNVRRNQIKLTVIIEEYTKKCDSRVRYIDKYVKQIYV